jgi:hypothetical protein
MASKMTKPKENGKVEEEQHILIRELADFDKRTTRSKAKGRGCPPVTVPIESPKANRSAGFKGRGRGRGMTGTFKSKNQAKLHPPEQPEKGMNHDVDGDDDVGKVEDEQEQNDKNKMDDEAVVVPKTIAVPILQVTGVVFPNQSLVNGSRRSLGI